MSTQRNLSVPQREFIRHFLETGNASESARLAGYKQPHVVGSKLKRKLKAHIESAEVKKELEKVMPPHEALEILGKIARGEEPKHREQLKAIELVLRSHGVLSDKIQVTLDRKALMAQVADYIRRLRVVDVESRLLPPSPPQADSDAQPPPNLPPEELQTEYQSTVMPDQTEDSPPPQTPELP